ncbi:MAG TPA: NUDIX domain-containing protein [Anaerolineales bacterium]|nr:NUDIX domain-containing protein [Anaerolineales bacterium]
MTRLLYLAFRIYCFLFRPVALGVRVMMIHKKEVLLVRQTYMDGWFMPGGGVKRGETLEQAARREAYEETGAALKNLGLVGVYTNFNEWKSDHNILFLSTDFTFSGKHDFEIAEVRFFPLHALPAGLWPGHRRRLEQYRNGKQPDPFGEW